MEFEVDLKHWPIMVVTIVGIVLFNLIKNRGWRGARFGAPVKKKVSELSLSTERFVKTRLEVHLLEPRETVRGPHVGVDLIASTALSWEKHPIALTRQEAERLANDLLAAVRESSA